MTQGQNIASLRAFLLDNQQQYAQQGRLREADRDAIEEEVGAYVRGCSANIAKLQEMLRTAPTASPAKQVPPSADLLAHRQGLVLILSERLGAMTAAFDRLRGLRYRQLEQEEANRRRRASPLAAPTAPRTSQQLHAALRAAQQQTAPSRGGLATAFDAAAGGAARIKQL